MMSYFHLFSGWIRQEIFAIPGRIIATVFFILLLTAPLITQDQYYMRILTMASIFSIFAISWDILSGVAGQLNLGHGMFVGVAGYGAALLNIHFNLPPWVTIPLGAVVAVGFGLLAAIPALRLRGMFLGLVTLALPIILTGVVFGFPRFTGGEMGLSGIARLTSSKILNYYIVVVTFLVSAFLMYKFVDPKSKHIRTGIILHALREDELAARASGIYTVRYKLLAFAVSGFFAGIAGGLYVHYIRLAGPSVLDLMFSFQAILWTIFGSIATVYGAVVGVFFLYPMMELLTMFEWGTEYRFIIYAFVLIFTLIFMPEGLTVRVLDKLEVKCPRCKVVNFFYRKKCRACRTLMRHENS
jgi:branched-chain amino acid transport system permease protein